MPDALRVSGAGPQAAEPRCCRRRMERACHTLYVTVGALCTGCDYLSGHLELKRAVEWQRIPGWRAQEAGLGGRRISRLVSPNTGLLL